jgi:hypothetical protein
MACPAAVPGQTAITATLNMIATERIVGFTILLSLDQEIAVVITGVFPAIMVR